MKKMLVIFSAITIMCFISIVKAEAFSITWFDWEYYGGLYVETETGYGEWLESSNTSPHTHSLGRGVESGYAYSWMSASPFTIGTETQTVSEDYGCYGEALAGGALYNTFIIENGAGQIPTWLTVDLVGSLSGGINGEGSNEAAVIAAMWFAEAGTFPEDLSSLLDFDDGDVQLGEPDWLYEEYLEAFNDTTLIDEHYRELGYPEAGQEYEVLAVLLSGSYSGTWDEFAQAYADTDFSSSLRFDLHPVPEPATMLLFGMGVLGFGALRKKKKL